jgi:GH15 family glucan-1,4-alpha-glucosidase
MVAEASRFRGGLDSELDSNGLVLRVLAIYAEWTGDVELLKEHSIIITAIANYLLSNEFVDEEIGMLVAARDIWERSENMGIEKGSDVAHQTFAILGLEAVSVISKYIGKTEKNLTWKNAAKKMRHLFFNHPTHSMIDEGRIIKRRLVNGEVQRTLTIKKKDEKYMSSLVPDEMPLGSRREHHIEPDVTQCFPIIYGLIDPKSDIAIKTIAECEKLWSQAWDGGGYGRYDVSGEPDSPGPWALATMFMASAQFEAGGIEKAMRSLNWLIERAGASGAWKEFYGERPTPPLPPTGILVWAWAQYITLFVKHILNVKLEGETLTSNARLEDIRANIRFRGNYIDLSPK